MAAQGLMARPAQLAQLDRLTVMLVLAVLAATAGGCQRAPADPPAVSAKSSPAPATEGAPPAQKIAGRPAVVPKPETLALARKALSSPGASVYDGACGPYQVLSTATLEYLAICRAIAADLDQLYQARLGITLPSPADGLIVIFGSAAAYRDFSSEFGSLNAGYAGFSMASRGVVALVADDVPAQRFATTLAHELTHLVHRRVLGFNLDPWLSEGLADALGDTATPTGFGQLSGVDAIEALAERLLQAIGANRAPSAAALMAKERQNFDRGVSYDYESSALLVRFLLLEPAAASAFRRVLRRIAAGGECDELCVLEELALSPEQLDRDFRKWLAALVPRAR